jgi:hypothetical protein
VGVRQLSHSFLSVLAVFGLSDTLITWVAVASVAGSFLMMVLGTVLTIYEWHVANQLKKNTADALAASTSLLLRPRGGAGVNAAVGTPGLADVNDFVKQLAVLAKALKGLTPAVAAFLVCTTLFLFATTLAAVDRLAPAPKSTATKTVHPRTSKPHLTSHLVIEITTTKGVTRGRVSADWKSVAGSSVSRICTKPKCIYRVPRAAPVALTEISTLSARWPFRHWVVSASSAGPPAIARGPKASVHSSGPTIVVKALYKRR